MRESKSVCVCADWAISPVVGYTIVRILQRFERVSKYWSDSGAQLKSDIVLSPKDGVKVGFWETKTA